MHLRPLLDLCRQLWVAYVQRFGQGPLTAWKDSVPDAAAAVAGRDDVLCTHLLWCMAVLGRLEPMVADRLRMNKHAQVRQACGGGSGS